MYEHYERHRTDNITDPALRRAHPISTISGWDRDRDENTENSPKPDSETSKTIAAAQTNGNAEHDDVVMSNVKCICEENVDKDTAETTANNETTKDASAQVSSNIEPTKPVSSISNISQVYNEQLTGHTATSNTDSQSERNIDASDTEKPTGEHVDDTSASNALRKTLEIESYDEDNKEIVNEIVEEILKKSENLLDDCKRSLDENQIEETETSSPVIKDGEIEHAVSEVVAGVRNIEKMLKQDTEIMVIDSLAQDTNETETIESMETNESILTIEDVAKTEICDTTITETTTETNEIEDIVSGIVNDVIENCINESSTTDVSNDGKISTTVMKNGDDVCDNDTNKTSIIQRDINVDNINNNSSEDNDVKIKNSLNNNTICDERDLSTHDSNDNTIIGETIEQTTELLSQTTLSESVDDNKQEQQPQQEQEQQQHETKTTPIEETDEEIVKGIVNEIVGKCCVENDSNANNSNENSSANGSENEATVTGTEINAISIESTNIVVGDNAQSTIEAEHVGKHDDRRNDNNNRSTKQPHRSQNTSSISTSTQVENNHFGN